MTSVTHSLSDGRPNAARRSALRQRMRTLDLDALLVTDLVNVRYLTGFTGSNGAVLIGGSEDSSALCTDGRYTTQAGAECPDLPVLIDRPCDAALVARARGRVGFEATAVTVADLHRLRAAAPHVELIETAGLVEAGRVIKDPTEVEALSAACSIADAAFAQLLDEGAIRTGVSERTLALELDQRMRLLGAAGPSFDTIVASGPHSAIPHHQPGARTVETGDFVKFDFGALVDGYHSDMTRTVVVGIAAAWQREVYDVVSAAQQAGRDAAVPGASGAQIDAAAREVIAAAGYAENFVHGLGHGVGLQIHEAPALAASSAVIMEPDMCVTVEPGVYLPGRGGVRIEDSGVIHPDGYRVLTQTSKELLEL